ncbi:MAG: hypothetical protein EOO68_27275 [Moraxellaceae bacterium]|nr:MAG: hypothetical protein EOO68_27275 [Moraxellaceae bacterium]
MVLGDPAENSSVSDLVVLTGDVYAIGMHNKKGKTPIACYWKNGKSTDLGDAGIYAGEQAIAVSGNDIYMLWAGTYNNQGFSRTSYTKNFGALETIKDAAGNFEGNSLALSGNDIYVSGFGISNTGNVFSPTYYKNTAPVLITDGPKSAFATSIALDGKDIYVSGWTENVDEGKSPAACYWINGKIVLLGNGSSQSLARKIMVLPAKRS